MCWRFWAPILETFVFNKALWVMFWEQGPGRVSWDEDDVATRMIFANNFF